jgi:hypothetical protein
VVATRLRLALLLRAMATRPRLVLVSWVVSTHSTVASTCLAAVRHPTGVLRHLAAVTSPLVVSRWAAMGSLIAVPTNQAPTMCAMAQPRPVVKRSTFPIRDTRATVSVMAS